MGTSIHTIRAFQMRKISHPILKSIDKYWLTVPAKELPANISTKANARDPRGLNRHVYKEVRSSLEGETAQLGTFDLMNKGITILAEQVRVIDKENGLFEVIIDDAHGGIVDGAHTAKIIWESNAAGTTPDEQYVELYIRTGVSKQQISEIARGLNTGIQVASQSIYNKAGHFDWMKKLVEKEPYAKIIAWNESDDREYDVRDLIGILEALNIFDFPNDINTSKHPISSYEKWSIPLEKFADDFEINQKNKSPKKSKYYRLRNLLKDGLVLYDLIRHDFREMRNNEGGRAGNMKIVEEASATRRSFDFPFARLKPSQYRLTKGATMPILAAFRSYVSIDETSGDAVWRSGFDRVKQVWKEAGPTLAGETYQLTQDGIRTPDQVGKNRKHWGTLYMRLQVQLLQEKLLEEQQRPRRRTS
jgi:hypothetical protein